MNLEYPKLKKGTLVFHGTWPAIVIEAQRRKHNTALEPILCEVFGFAHESGSCYRKDLACAISEEQWRRAVKTQGFDPDHRYFKGELLIAENESGQKFLIM